MKARFILRLFFSVVALGTLSGQGKSLTVEEAVSLSLASDFRIRGALLDAQSAKAKVEEAKLRQLPSVSLSASYTRLSDLKSTVSLGLAKMTIDSLDNVYTFAANMQYPVFAGFRLQEAVKLADAQVQGKEISAEMTKRAVAFETERAYWEAVRATYNVKMLEENLSLMTHNLDMSGKQLSEGTLMNADLLSAQMRADQAAMEKANGVTVQTRAFLALASLVSDEGSAILSKDALGLFELSTKPEDSPGAATALLSLGSPPDEASLVSAALSRRPETRGAAIALRIAEGSVRLAKSPLYPSLNVSGNYTYADPNPRVAFQSDPALFTGTWTLGVSLSYDLGGLPANLAALDAQDKGFKKSAEDKNRQNEVVALDVRNCYLAWDQVSRDIAFVSRMLDQAKESERVTKARLDAGTASETDLLSAKLARLRSEFAITNKQIDRQIATADLCRAAALTDLK